MRQSWTASSNAFSRWPELTRGGIRGEGRCRRPLAGHLERSKRSAFEIERIDRQRPDAWEHDAQLGQEARIRAPERMDHNQTPGDAPLSVLFDEARQPHRPCPLGTPEPG